MRISALETTGTINDRTVNLILDTGSAYSYIDGKLVTELGLKREDVDEKASITVDGSKIVTKKKVPSMYSCKEISAITTKLRPEF